MSKKISKYRSEVIEKFINIEWLINAVISQYYFKKVIYSFVFDLLYDVNCTFALKRNVLQKIAPEFSKSKLEELNRLNNIRNFFAHCNQKTFKSITKPSPREKGKVLNPKNIKKELDFEELYQEFVKKEVEITKALAELYKSFEGKIVF